MCVFHNDLLAETQRDKDKNWLWETTDLTPTRLHVHTHTRQTCMHSPARMQVLDKHTHAFNSALPQEHAWVFSWWRNFTLKTTQIVWKCLTAAQISQGMSSIKIRPTWNLSSLLLHCSRPQASPANLLWQALAQVERKKGLKPNFTWSLE